jgi:hypothetical protein
MSLPDQGDVQRSLGATDRLGVLASVDGPLARTPGAGPVLLTFTAPDSLPTYVGVYGPDAADNSVPRSIDDTVALPLALFRVLGDGDISIEPLVDPTLRLHPSDRTLPGSSHLPSTAIQFESMVRIGSPFLGRAAGEPRRAASRGRSGKAE